MINDLQKIRYQIDTSLFVNLMSLVNIQQYIIKENNNIDINLGNIYLEYTRNNNKIVKKNDKLFIEVKGYIFCDDNVKTNSDIYLNTNMNTYLMLLYMCLVRDD